MQGHNLDQLARDYHAYVASDGSGFRRAARVRQSMWREAQGLPIGEHRGLPLGSRLPVDFAEKTLANYLTPRIREVVRSELSSSSADERLFAAPRIYNDLLSSQPLCFNLFAELKLDLGLATAVFKALRPGMIKSVLDIRFEQSPGRGDPRFTGDRSAFDVFVEYATAETARGFLGIEVKYHENLRDAPAAHRTRYDEVAAAMGCFRPEAFSLLQGAPLQQIWRDHLLAGVTQRELGYGEGVFVFVYPAANVDCRAAVQAYRSTLKNCSWFEAWTLEEVVAVLSTVTEDSWVGDFWELYLDLSNLGAG
jgi:hypothetical protein